MARRSDKELSARIHSYLVNYEGTHMRQLIRENEKEPIGRGMIIFLTIGACALGVFLLSGTMLFKWLIGF